MGELLAASWDNPDSDLFSLALANVANTMRNMKCQRIFSMMKGIGKYGQEIGMIS